MAPRLTILIALAGLCAACGEKQPPRRPGEPYLKAIEIEGNEKLGDKTLVTGLALRRTKERGRPPDPYLIQVDADRVRGEYLRKGFLAIDVRSRVEREGDAATVIYSVDEGERARTHVVITGLPDDPDLPVSKVRDQLPLEEGAPFDYAVYEAAKEPLIAVLHDAGYAHAKLDATVYADRANHRATIGLAYTPGPKSRFGDVEITGVEGELAEAIRARLQFEVGDSYSTMAIAATQRQLYAMERFSTVQVIPDDNVDPVIEVRIAVSLAARHEISLGGGLGINPSAYEPRARAGYSIAGWPTPLDKLTLDLRPAYAYVRSGAGWQPRIRAIANLERQDLFWTYSKGEVGAGYNYLAVEAFTSYGPRARLGLQTPVRTDRVQVRAGWSIERLAFRDISPLLGPDLRMELGLGEAQRVGAYQQALTVDLRDNPVNTRLGLWGELLVVEGTKFAGGAFDYLQLVPELRGFVPFGRVVLAARVRGGTFLGGEIPATERFFSGGGTRHRGFGERSLSPMVVGDIEGETFEVPYGGTALFETSVEARVRIATWRAVGVGAVVFLDGGDVVEDRDDLDLSNLHWAIGAGLRFETVVGPVRLDLGYRLNRTGPTEPAPGSRFALHLSIGEAF